MIRKMTLRELRTRIQAHLIEGDPEYDVTSQERDVMDDPSEFGYDAAGNLIPGEESGEDFPEIEPADKLSETLANAFKLARDEGMILQDIANTVADMLSDEMRGGSDIHSTRDAFESWYISRSQTN